MKNSASDKITRRKCFNLLVDFSSSAADQNILNHMLSIGWVKDRAFWSDEWWSIEEAYIAPWARNTSKFFIVNR
jgi:hypothetical protein